MRAKFSRSRLRDCVRVMNARGVDLDYLPRDDLTDRIVAINQMQ